MKAQWEPHVEVCGFSLYEPRTCKSGPRYGLKPYQSKRVIGGKMFLLRVIVDDAVDPALVVTAYRTTKIEKYWGKP
ncbi:MAG: hypothetical protein LAP13_22805 [Acidobacteriia bacterium]|nr:hypothetical protein [Terriglobia bacterium]